MGGGDNNREQHWDSVGVNNRGKVRRVFDKTKTIFRIN
jgi:hypothetical protein